MTPLIIQKSEIIQNKQKEENHIRLLDDNFCGKFELNQTDGQIANILLKEIIVKNNNEKYNFDEIIKNLAYPNDKDNIKEKEKIQTYVNVDNLYGFLFICAQNSKNIFTCPKYKIII
jgi:predicted ATP-dependent protease